MKQKLFFFTVVIFFFTCLFAQENDNVYQVVRSGFHVDKGIWDIKAGFDLDKDGRQEILAASDSGGVTLILFEVAAIDGQDQYRRVWSATIPQARYGLALCAIPTDLDRDGKEEIIVGVADTAATGQEGMYIYEWDGNLGSDNYNFATSWNLNRNGQKCAVSALAAFDFDNDGRQEVIAGEATTNLVYVAELTNRDVANPVWSVEFVDSTLAGSPRSITFGDFDNDGNHDVAISEWHDNGLLLIEAKGMNTYSTQLHANLSPGTDGVAYNSLQNADLDDDGLAEIYYPSTNGTVFVVTNNGYLTTIDARNIFQIAYFEKGCRGSFLGDQDKGYGIDGPDLYIGGGGVFCVWDLEFSGLDPTNPLSWTRYQINLSGDSTYIHSVAGGLDYDGDGEREIFAASPTDFGTEAMLFIIEHVSYPRADLGQNLVFSYPPDSQTGLFNQVRMICPNVDTDKDGKMEFILENHFSGARFYIFENNGDNNYQLVFTSPGEGWYWGRSVTTGDLDHDGLPEIIFSGWNEQNANAIAIYEWKGTIGENSYSFATYYNSGLQFTNRYHDVTDVEIADVDNDGIDELLICQRQPSDQARGLLIVSETGGDIHHPQWMVEFDDATLPDHTTVKWSPYDIWIGDADNDGRKDIYLSYWNYGGGFWYESTGRDQYRLTAKIDAPSVLKNSNLDGTSLIDVKGIDMNDDGYLELYSGIYDHSLLCIPVTADVDSTTMNNETPVRLAALSNPWGVAVGNLDGNDKKNIYVAASGRIYDWEFTGTDVRNPAHYQKKIICDFRRIAYDVIDQFYKMKTDNVITVEIGDDLDRDGKQELLVGLAPEDADRFTPLQSVLLIFEETTTGIEPVWAATQPAKYALHDNYPNPFSANGGAIFNRNSSTTISYDIAKPGKVTLKIYNMLGQEVKTLVDNKMKSIGTYLETWDGTANSGEKVASGVYIYTLRVGKFAESKRMSLLR